MKDWKTPEIKDLAISDTECTTHNGQNGHGGQPIPVGSGACQGDMNFDDHGKEHGKNHHGGKH